MQKLSVQLSDARNKGEFGHVAFGGCPPPPQALANPIPSLPLEENLHPQSSCVQGQVPIFPETLRQPEKLKEETRSSAAAGDTQDEVGRRGTHKGPWGRKGRSGPTVNIRAHRQLVLRKNFCRE